MKENACLYCYQPLEAGQTGFHPACSKAFFGITEPPLLGYDLADMDTLAATTINQRIAVTGVQPKMSLDIEMDNKDPKTARLTIVGLWGHFILKPPTAMFPNLPENEDLTMRLAKLFGIEVADHSLIRLKSGELAYITKRFDRKEKEKLAVEDMCQLTETLTANKYNSSMEKIGKKIWAYSSRPGLDAARFFEITVFSFLTANADMHLKNFSLLTGDKGEVVLSPAYDLLCTPIAMPEDKEEMALTINGRKNKLQTDDFDKLATNLKLSAKTVSNIYKKFGGLIDTAGKMIDASFLPADKKNAYKAILTTRAARIKLGTSYINDDYTL